MAAVRHLGFLKVKLFNCGYNSEGQCASLDMAIFLSAILHFKSPQYLPLIKLYVIIPISMSIRRTFAEMCSFNNFSTWRPFAMLDWEKVEIFMVDGVKTVNCVTKVREDECNRCQHTAI